MYKLKTPNGRYNGVTEGVPFSKGIGQTDDKNIRNVLVNDYKYEDITDYEVLSKPAKEVGENTATAVKKMSEALQELADAPEENTKKSVKRTENLSDMTVPQLKELAKSLGLTHYSNLKHAELVELLEKETTK